MGILLLPRPREESAVFRVTVVCAMIVSVYWASYTRDELRRYHQYESAGLIHMIELAEPGSKVLCMHARRSDSFMFRPTMSHNCYGMVQYWGGHFGWADFAKTGYNLVIYKKGVQHLYPSEVHWPFDAALVDTDYVLVRNDRGHVRSPLVELVEHRPAAAEGTTAWSLYRVIRHTPRSEEVEVSELQGGDTGYNVGWDCPDQQHLQRLTTRSRLIRDRPGRLQSVSSIQPICSTQDTTKTPAPPQTQGTSIGHARQAPRLPQSPKRWYLGGLTGQTNNNMVPLR